MIKSSVIAAAATITLSLSACSGNEAPGAGDVTETQMDDVDVIDGTISDDMVDVDTIKAVDATGAEKEESSDKTDSSASANDSESAAETEE
ncbi:hypothetical protein [Parasphingorhabdus sp.]|uniref:hypothetical protein n=1 Tax=Parasphingorhabdus sp. TaxID=2709688 RepID=UPI003A8D8CD5